MNETIQTTIPMKTDSWELTKNSKGFNYAVKVYGDDVDTLKAKMQENLKAIKEVMREVE